MIYLNENDMQSVGINWDEIACEIEKAVGCLNNGDYSQPIKPYLRYRDPVNRIIAMPAFLGGSFDIAGIKWIASFPNNLNRNLPRAHSVVILNHADTGRPLAIINTPLLSVIRTAAVSAAFIKYFDRVRDLKDINIGIIGWGPIGRYHYKMCTGLMGDRISRVFLYDIRGVDIEHINDRGEIYVANCWEDVYINSDIVITCTVSESTYIDKRPKRGALLLNVSLRDYRPEAFEYVKGGIIVDDWDEVCRENTDIEVFSKLKGLKREDTKSITDVVCGGCIATYPQDQTIMFNPMGMAVFDIAVASYYYKKSISLGVGTGLY